MQNKPTEQKQNLMLVVYFAVNSKKRRPKRPTPDNKGLK